MAANPTLPFTPLQERLLAVLSDGMPHHRDELYSCLDDDLADPGALRVAIHYLRKKLNRKGHTIICEVGQDRLYRYRHVILLRPPADG
jgi:DNA-binding response OmpR family regulator